MDESLNKRLENLEDIPTNRAAKIKSFGKQISPSQLRMGSTSLKTTTTRKLATEPTSYDIEKAHKAYMLGRLKPVKIKLKK